MIILKNNTNVVRAKAEAVNTSIIADSLLFAASKRETRDFILTVVENTWVRKLHGSVTFYTAVAPYELLDHLNNLCGGLHAINVLAPQK